MTTVIIAFFILFLFAMLASALVLSLLGSDESLLQICFCALFVALGWMVFAGVGILIQDDFSGLPLSVLLIVVWGAFGPVLFEKISDRIRYSDIAAQEKRHLSAEKCPNKAVVPTLAEYRSQLSDIDCFRPFINSEVADAVHSVKKGLRPVLEQNASLYEEISEMVRKQKNEENSGNLKQKSWEKNEKQIRRLKCQYDESIEEIRKTGIRMLNEEESLMRLTAKAQKTIGYQIDSLDSRLSAICDLQLFHYDCRPVAYLGRGIWFLIFSHVILLFEAQTGTFITALEPSAAKVVACSGQGGAKTVLTIAQKYTFSSKNLSDSETELLLNWEKVYCRQRAFVESADGCIRLFRELGEEGEKLKVLSAAVDDQRSRIPKVCQITGRMSSAILALICCIMLSSCISPNAAAIQEVSENIYKDQNTIFLVEDPPQEMTESDSPGKSTEGLFVPKETLNIRSGAGTSYEIIGTAEPGTRYTLTGRSEKTSKGSVWHEIFFGGGKTGWVSGNYGNIINGGM